MSSKRLLDYPTAVAMADSALTAILESLRRPERTWTLEDRETAAIAFVEWLREHPDVEDVLQEAEEFERFSMEDYIAIHSVTWEVLFNEPEPGAPIDSDVEGDSVLIRRRRQDDRGETVSLSQPAQQQGQREGENAPASPRPPPTRLDQLQNPEHQPGEE